MTKLRIVILISSIYLVQVCHSTRREARLRKPAVWLNVQHIKTQPIGPSHESLREGNTQRDHSMFNREDFLSSTDEVQLLLQFVAFDA